MDTRWPVTRVPCSCSSSTRGSPRHRAPFPTRHTEGSLAFVPGVISALTFSRSIGPATIYLRPDVLNLFNSRGVLAVNTTVLTRVNGGAAFEDFKSFTTTRREGTNWTYGPRFGKPRSPADYQLARTFRITMGAHF